MTEQASILPGTGRDIPGRLPSTKLFDEIREIQSEENLLKSLTCF